MKYSRLLQLLIGSFMFYVGEDGGGGTPTPTPAPASSPSPSPSPTPTPAPAAVKSGNPLLDDPIETIPVEWQAHARELRRENAKFRELAKTFDEKAAQDKIDAAVKAAVDAQDAKTQEILKKERDTLNRRVIGVEVRTEAAKLGIQNMDDLKLVDTSKLAVNDETGEVAGVAELLAEFKKTRPYLFKEPVVDTTQSLKTPKKDGAKAFDARTATKEEIEADAKSRGLNLKNY